MEPQTRDRLPPEGVVTILLAGFEASSALRERHPEAMRAALDEIDTLVAEACVQHRAVSPRHEGEGFLLAFARASDGVACAWALRNALANRAWPVGLRLRFRMALHAGELECDRDGRYSGSALDRVARLRDLAHDGQLLMTRAIHGLVAEALPAGTRIQDHGRHAFSARDAREPVFELVGEEDEPHAARAVDEAGQRLPAETTALIGREAECAAATEQLGYRALVTLVGAAGSGKTRLAIRLAHELARSRVDGARWVDGAALRDPALVATAVAAATGVSELSTEDPSTDLARKLQHRDVLIVLDNCEHLIETCAELATALIAIGSELRILATSREPLGVEGEVLVPIPPLAVPPESDDPAVVGAADAARLLVERAAGVHAGFSLTGANARAIAGICRKLDGLPLALELAAARLRVLSPEQVHDALADRFRILTGGEQGAAARQRTLEASIAWSYDLLDDDERSGLRRLAVFPGSFDLAAAEAVCADADLHAYALLDLLSRLVERSLVIVDTSGAQARYVLLETIRVYARERLTETNEVAAARERHGRHYAQLLRELAPGLASADPRAALAKFDAELPNVRAALDWSADSERAGDTIAMIEASQGFWAMRGLQPEMYGRLEGALETPGLDAATQARGYITASGFATRVGEMRAATRYAAPGLELARAGEDPTALCDALTLWSWPSFQAGTAKAEDCLAALDEACALAERLGDPHRLWQALSYRAALRAASIGMVDGIVQLERALALAQEIGSPPLLAISHVFLTVGYRVLQRLEEAREQARLAIRHSEGLVVGAPVAMAHSNLAAIEMMYGDLDAAAANLELARAASLVSGRRLGAEVWGDPELEAAELAYRRGDRDEARRRVEAGIATARERGSTDTLIWDFLASLLDLDAGDPARARQRLEENALHARFTALPLISGWTKLSLAYAARAEASLDEAWTHAHGALDASVQAAYRLYIAISLEEVGGLAAGRDRGELGARLLGAADRALADYPGARRPIEEAARAHALGAARAALGAEAFERAFEEGRALSLDEAVELAQRGRGSRSRPMSGWASLTPAELDVVRLAGEGLSNTAIAARLFVSINTVKTHLVHAYGKLELSTRAELVAEAARRPAD